MFPGVIQQTAGLHIMIGEFPAQRDSNAENVSFDDVIITLSFYANIVDKYSMPVPVPSTEMGLLLFIVAKRYCADCCQYHTYWKVNSKYVVTAHELYV